MRSLKFAAAAASQIYRKNFLRSVPISRRSLSVASGFVGAAGIGRTYAREKLPAELSALSYVAELTCKSAARGGVCHVYLIGARHDSKKSCEEVKAAIEFVKPEVVFLELCTSRAYFVKPENAREGGEFWVAYKEGTKYGADVIFGDRPQEITLERFPMMAHFLEVLVSPLKFSFINMIAIIKKLLEKDVVGAILLIRAEKARMLPSYYETITFERDRYMSATLLEVARKHSSVVAIVGMAHVNGIQKNWEQPVDMKQLLHAPTRTRMVARVRHVLFGIFRHLNWVLLLVLLLLEILGRILRQAS